MTAACVCGASFDRILNQSVGSLREYDSVEDNKIFEWDKDWAVRRPFYCNPQLQHQPPAPISDSNRHPEYGDGMARHHMVILNMLRYWKKNESMFITAKRKEIGACKRGGRPGVRTLFDDRWWTLKCASSSIGVQGMGAALMFGQSRAQLAGFGSAKFSNSRVPVLIEVYNFCIASIIIIIIDYQILAIEMLPADERH